MLLTTHDLSDIEELCAQLMIIDHGRLLFDGGLTELKQQFWREIAVRVDFRDRDQAQRLSQLELPGIRCDKQDELSCRLRFAREEYSAADVIRQVVNAVEVRERGY